MVVELRGERALVDLIEQVPTFLKISYPLKIPKTARRIRSERGLRKVFRTYFLPKILPREIKEELTYLFLYKLYMWKGEHEKAEKTLENWRKAVRKFYRKCEEYDVDSEFHEGIEKLRIRFPSGTIYYPVFEILKIDSVLEGKLLKVLLETLYSSSKLLRGKIKVEDFCEMLWETLKTPYKMSENEIKVLNALIKNPKAKIEEISKITHLAPSSVTLILKRLEERQVYTANSIVKFDKLGLKHIIVRMPFRKDLRFPYKLNRYLLSIQYVLGDRGEYLASFALPAKRIIGAKRMLTKSFGRSIKIYEVKNFQFHLCLDHYNYNLHKWEVDYEELVNQIEKQASKKLFEKKIEEISITKEKETVFDRKDLEILRILTRNWKLSIRELSKILNLAKSAVHKRLLKIEKLGFLEQKINIHRLGLTEDIALIVKSNDQAFLDTLIRVLRKLPKFAAYKLKETRKVSKRLKEPSQYLFWLTLPSGDTIRFLRTFPSILKKHGDFEILYRWHYYSWFLFPDPKLYEEELKTWKWR